MTYGTVDYLSEFFRRLISRFLVSICRSGVREVTVGNLIFRRLLSGAIIVAVKRRTLEAIVVK